MASSESPPAKRRRHDYTDTITVLVGEEEKKFIIHEEVITRRSDFSRAACGSNWKEGQEKIVRLPAVAEDVFKSYIHWISSGTVVIKEDDEPPANGIWGYLSLCRLYVAGDALGDMALRNAVMDRLFAGRIRKRNFPGVDPAEIAYTQTPEGSNLRNFLIDVFAIGTFPKWIKERGDKLPVQFLVDIIHARMTNKYEKSAKLADFDKCRYHEHNDELPACKS